MVTVYADAQGDQPGVFFAGEKVHLEGCFTEKQADHLENITPRPACAHCKFWDCDEPPWVLSSHYGIIYVKWSCFCRRHPPTILAATCCQQDPTYHSPETAFDGWCGEFQERKEEGQGE